jgi:CDP-diacylglycerol--serine O-phosphatidyltransferase
MRMRRPRRARQPRLKGLSINRLVPNVLTMLNLCAGLTAIRYGLHARWELAVLAIIGAGVFDVLDGLLARLLKGQSKFGAELDSLSDVVSFGVAPAILLYLWVMSEAGSIGWSAVLVFSVCAALRLARFNTRAGDAELPPWAFNYFTGVPAPAGAGLVLLPMILSFETGPRPAMVPSLAGPIVVGSWAVIVGMLMISSLPTFSLKGIRVPQRLVVPVLVGVGLLAASLVSAPWATLAAIGLAYLASLPVSRRQFLTLQREAMRLHGEVEAELPAGVPAALPPRSAARAAADETLG